MGETRQKWKFDEDDETRHTVVDAADNADAAAILQQVDLELVVVVVVVIVIFIFPRLYTG